MSLAERLTAHLGEAVADPEEETFILYCRPRTTHSLGFIDPKASSVDVTIHNKDYTIHQSPSILSSSRAGGTTGAVLWAITPLFASWISSPAPLAFLPPPTSVLELGCGISPLNALALASTYTASSPPVTRRYVLTDQSYVSRFIARNLSENEHHLQPPKRNVRGGKANRAAAAAAAAAAAESPAVSSQTTTTTTTSCDIQFKSLDWETDAVASTVGSQGFDLVVACDCVYNEALIKPLLQTCADACQLRRAEGEEDGGGEAADTACVIAQQLRDDTVFEAWLTTFMSKFRAWRVADGLLPAGLRVEDGFVIYIGVLKSKH
ncbi:hypothetical protein NLU13_4757 [Sarocladium strictum]|uniref:Diaminohydroxyphosphoribosylamino-pyrimidine deaminase n=1 Tax=Sarocladium strictum TaxID=5046 RepID=A0AA39GK99_SARSR|nr:hypothetical protein NLU13_4757 [Sarocladium strictum]